MTIPNRTVTMSNAVFAEDAITTIPQSPVAGASYRNTAMTTTEVKNGWAFKTITDSAKFNQYQYKQSYLTNQIEKYGFMPWSNLTEYVAGSAALGSDGNIYRALRNTGPSSTAYDPVNDTTNTYWRIWIAKSVGSSTKPVYTDSNGILTASNSTVGSNDQPVYMNGGTITALSGQVAKVGNNNAFTGVNSFSNLILTTVNGDALKRHSAGGGWSTHRLGKLGSLTYSGVSATSPNGTEAYFDVMAGDDNSTQAQASSGVIRSIITWVLNANYPVGSIYIGTQASCPIANYVGTWEQIQGRYLLASGTLVGTSETYGATNTVASGLPNITGTFPGESSTITSFWDQVTGAFYQTSETPRQGIYKNDDDNTNVGFSASRSNNIYGSSGAVRAPAYVVNVWRRTG